MWVAQHFKLVNSGVPVLLNTVNLFHRCVRGVKDGNES
jgi:hypothetical protein